MTIVQFITAMERYSVDVLALALVVCFFTSIFKKIIPSDFKKYITFVPFILGIAIYAGFLVVNNTEPTFIISSQTMTKGFECGAAATIYYVLYEQFIRGKKNQTQVTDIKQLISAEILKNLVLDSKLEGISEYLAEKIYDNLNDPNYCVTLCINALRGKTKAGVSDNDMYAVANILVKTLSSL